jgi:hypothetical protein
VPITPFLRGQAFDPELVSAMGAALSKTCDELGLTERSDATLVAEKIIELAERGLRNPTAIHRMAMNELKFAPDRTIIDDSLASEGHMRT